MKNMIYNNNNKYFLIEEGLIKKNNSIYIVKNYVEKMDLMEKGFLKKYIYNPIKYDSFNKSFINIFNIISYNIKKLFY
jgi:hypothetical protein